MSLNFRSRLVASLLVLAAVAAVALLTHSGSGATALAEPESGPAANPVPGVTATRMAVVPEPEAAAADAVQAILREAVPGIKASLSRDPMVPAHYLSLVASDDSLRVPGSDAPLAKTIANLRGDERVDQVLLASADLGWRTRMAVAVAAVDNSAIARYQLALPDSKVLDRESPLSLVAQNQFVGTIRAEAGAEIQPARPELGSISLSAARRQGEANVAAIAAALPENTLQASTVDAFMVNEQHNAIGVQVRLQVADLRKVEGAYGDLLTGPSNGLIGDSGAVVEGVSVVVRDDAGRELSAWRTERGVTATEMASQALTLPRSAPLHGKYRNLTGGPEAPVVRLMATGPRGDEDVRADSSETTDPQEAPTPELVQKNTIR